MKAFKTLFLLLTSKYHHGFFKKLIESFAVSPEPGLGATMKAETLSLSQTAVSTRVFSGLRTAGVCLLVLLISASFDSTSSRETRDAYRRVKANLLSHPYAVDKIPPNVVSRENINILIGFDPEQASGIHF